MSRVEELESQLAQIQVKANVLMMVTAQICVEQGITPDTLIERLEAMESEILGNVPTN